MGVVTGISSSNTGSESDALSKMNFVPATMRHTAVIVNAGTEKMACVKFHPYAVQMASIPNVQQPKMASEHKDSVDDSFISTTVNELLLMWCIRAH